jgi:(S)-mandelate dehydrogenase
MKRSVSKAYSIEDLRRSAKKRLPRAVFDFFDGGAEDELTLQDNAAAYKRQRLVPRVLTDVSSVDTHSVILGQPAKLPMAIAPTGAVGFGWRGGDVAIARAAALAGIPYTLSSTATASIEQIAKAAPGRLWFQAYILRNKPFLEALIQRAHAADYEALVITVDLPVGGKRERDFRNDFSVPFRFTPKNVIDFMQHPTWLASIIRHGMPVMENLIGLDAQATSSTAIASSVGRNYDPAFNWDGLQKIRDDWPRKLIVKGILSPDDALRVVNMGGDAVVVSNHGGRQLDGAVATFDALPGVVQAVKGRIPVLLDGGIRRGSDVVKALACGAQGVMLGRATLYGASAAGEPGASRAITILKDELVRTMQLCGVCSTHDIDASLLFSAKL